MGSIAVYPVLVDVPSTRRLLRVTLTIMFSPRSQGSLRHGLLAGPENTLYKEAEKDRAPAWLTHTNASGVLPLYSRYAAQSKHYPSTARLHSPTKNDGTSPQMHSRAVHACGIRVPSWRQICDFDICRTQPAEPVLGTPLTPRPEASANKITGCYALPDTTNVSPVCLCPPRATSASTHSDVRLA